ncbi:MAG: hypothetical protein RIR45_1405 [Pseudomonadota bacterium]
MQRRRFIGWGATLSLAGSRAWAAQNASAPYRATATAGQRRLLVLMLRGAMDGLTALPPIGDPALRSIRGNLVPEKLLQGSPFFGVHPALPTFAALLEQGQALAVHATGFAYKGRSHFEGQDIMQSGVVKAYTSASGWLGRAMERANLGNGVAISIPMPLILRGDSRSETQFPNWMQTPPESTYALVRELWSKDADLSLLGQRLVEGRQKMGMSQPTGGNFEQRKSPAGLAREAALRMLPADGPMVGLIDFDGFDTHASQGAAEGSHASKLKMVDEVIKAFRETMGARWADSLVLTVTEFGRTAAENGTTGTDHGWGSCILAAGGLVQPAGIVADWPGLDKAQLFEGRDLAVTVDAAAVYAEALQTVFGLSADQIQDGVLTHRPHGLTSSLFRA